jgi:3-deoxy-manno-octulosonate cytidylyltransferase (CMP-KDO synthetase)
VTAIAIIPARMGASRFPGKPLAKIRGIPMIGHCYFRTARTTGLKATYIATCDQEIADYAASIGAPAIMTATTHNRATDRTAEAMVKVERSLGHSVSIVVMMQGDEPLITPDAIAKVLAPFDERSVEIVNVISPIRTDGDFVDKGNVKVVVNRHGDAIYFSREPIPCTWKNIPETPRFMQLGVIGFRREALLRFNDSAETILEQCESVDMNRVIENGGSIRTVVSESRTIGVDSPTDLAAAEILMADDTLMQSYGGA